MGNSGSAAIGVEGNSKECSNKTSSSDLQQKIRNEVHQHRSGADQKYIRPKVLPDLGSPLRLRRTDNGEILHNGGTISARRQVGSSSPGSYKQYEVRDEQVSRRMRLFKTRNDNRNLSHDDYQSFQHFVHPPASLKRSLSTPHFDGELMPTSEQIRSQETTVNTFTENSTDWKNGELLKPSSPIHTSSKPSAIKTSTENAFNSVLQHQVHESFEAVRNQNKIIRPSAKPSSPVKRFYFGMNANEDLNDSQVLDNFRTKLQLSQDNFDGFLSLPNSDSADVVDDETCQGGISVQLRATLPRKQLDIPQFSPLTAWRLLSCGEVHPRGDPSGQFEEELEVLSSSHSSHLHHHHYHHHVLLVDKSQDSGISADDSPRIDSQVAWTPQQDLEETSSDGGFPPFAAFPSDNCQIARFSPRFMLSLPRNDRINMSSEQYKEGERMVRKERIKCDDRVVSKNDGGSPLVDSNWVLSRSMPSLLNSASLRPSQWSSVDVSFDDEDLTTALVKQPSFSYLANGGHIMYLPQYSKNRFSDKDGKLASRNNLLSASCEDVTSEAVSIEPVHSPPEISDLLQPKSEKKFTFQSTIRQLERKKLADKLSKEAETKENKRRIELEAMRKAEEEFQRKREREKIGIRQQLKLFNLSGSPTSTQILSEYHIPSRDYREYRNNKLSAESDSPTPEGSKKSTVHPAVTYQIPKSTQIYFNPRTNGDRGEEATNQALGVDNYRKKFAQGGVSNSLVLTNQSPVCHFTSFDLHMRNDSQLRIGNTTPIIQTDRLSEGRPTCL